jgi:hypothetical protein
MASIWPEQEPQLTLVDAGGLLYMRVTLLLLYGFLEIAARGDGSQTRLGMEFNTVAWECLSEPLRQLLTPKAAAAAVTADRAAYRPAVRPDLESLPLKFLNGVRIFVSLPGEELEELVFQPGLWDRRGPWPLFFRKPITADTLLTLTSHFLVVIQEELSVAQGWIVSYIPRSSILGIRSQPRGPWSELAVELKRGDQAAEVGLRLRSDAAQAWRERWARNGGQWQDLPEEPGEGPTEQRAGGGSV